MKRLIKVMTVFLFAFTLLVSATAVKAEYSVKINQIDTTNFPEIKAYVSIVDDTSKPVKSLLENYFNVMEDGAPGPTDFKIESMLLSGEPIAVVLAIDTSGSARGKVIKHAREAAFEFVEGLGENDLVAIVDFNDQEHIISEFTSDKETLKKAIEGLKVSGTRTTLYDAIYKSLEMASRPALPFRRVVIVLSDGKDEGSALTISDGIAKAQASNIPVYTIGLGSKVDNKPLARISRLTGGISLLAPTSADLATLYDMISEQLKNQYILTYVSSSINGDGQQHTLGLSVDIGDSIFKDERVFTAPKTTATTMGTWIWIAVVVLIIMIIILIIVVVTRTRASGGLKGESSPGSATISESMTIIDSEMGGDETVMQSIRREGGAHPPDKTIIMKGMGEDFVSAWIEITKGPDKGKSFNLKEERTKIGRSGACEISLYDDTISREQAVIVNEDGKYRLTDLASANGTFVDGKKITTRVIKDGDKIGFGNTEVVLKTVKSK
jgi:VWFA-related protein